MTDLLTFNKFIERKFSSNSQFVLYLICINNEVKRQYITGNTYDIFKETYLCLNSAIMREKLLLFNIDVIIILN